MNEDQKLTALMDAARCLQQTEEVWVNLWDSASSKLPDTVTRHGNHKEAALASMGVGEATTGHYRYAGTLYMPIDGPPMHLDLRSFGRELVKEMRASGELD